MLEDREKNKDVGSVEIFEEATAQDAKGKEGTSKTIKQKTMNEMVKDRELVIQDICKCIYSNALPFNLVRSPLFIQMLKSVGEYGRGLKPPSYHEVRVSHLKKAVDKIQESLVKYKREWEKWGCTLMCDGWTDRKGRSLANFLVNSPGGTVFLKSVDTSSVIKDAKQMFELLDNIVEEIGEDNVVQVVTDGASNLMATWKIKYSKGRELARPAVTRFATAYLTLSCILQQKNALRTMFASNDWVSSSFASKSDGKQMADMIFGDSRFWSSIKYCLKCVSPLVKVLRLVDGDSKPAMPYIYEATDRAKEEIANNFEKKESRYKKIWKIIDTRWNLQLHRPLHAAAYFLNPKFHYDEKFNADQEVYFGLYETIEKMISDRKTRFLVDQQLEAFKSAKGLFGRSMAIDTRNKKQCYGGEGKELQKVAMRILSLTCSATGCERNWSTFDQVHTKRRNRLEQQRLNALVFVKYNLQLEMRQKIREEKRETYDPICLSDIEFDDEWITEKENPCLPVDGSWMDIHESFTFDEGAPSKKRKRGPRNLNAKISSKGKSIVEQENENEDNVEDGEEEDDEEATLLMEDDHELSDIDLGDDE
ncbi:uncharacterized protein LOC114758322 [Neltuma alba]|uniref:uncharacterized protein LOC114758322 n=1 Tax=Neltuma alba TaxID=207710 RepID=UPI0010A529C2|nr:uncharacterized protein LOC114758322 [Prosopis alba]